MTAPRVRAWRRLGRRIGSSVEAPALHRSAARHATERGGRRARDRGGGDGGHPGHLSAQPPRPGCLARASSTFPPCCSWPPTGALASASSPHCSARWRSTSSTSPRPGSLVAHSGDWAALAAFVLVALAAGTIAELARSRALEAEGRRAEADLAAALARELLRGEGTERALATTARRVAEGLGLRAAAIEPGIAAPDPRRLALALRDAAGEQIATLLVSRDLPPDAEERLRARWLRPWRRWWPSPSAVTPCRPRRSRRRFCAAAMRSRPRSCGPSPTICAPR